MSDAEKLVENLIGDTAPEPEINPKAMVNQMKSEQDAQAAELRSRGVVSPQTVAIGHTIWHRQEKNADGTAARAKVTSIKTWKRRPDDFEIGWKHGMYTYGKINPQNAPDWTTVEPPAVTRKRR
jgi:hypothetical protein